MSDEGRPGGAGPAVSVSAALEGRRSVRAFLDRPVDRARLEDLVRRAARAPSSGNLQPWHVRILDGEAMTAFRQRIDRRVIESPEGEPLPSPFYPGRLTEPQLRSRRRNGEILYGALGIDRHDSEARRFWNQLNFSFFGAPAAVFLFLDRSSTPYQWLDLGIYLQSLLLLLEENGLATCPQADWAMYGRTVCEELGMGPDQMLICGVSVGHADPSHPENFLRTERDDPLAINPGEAM